MPDSLNVHLLPSCVPSERLAGRCAVVIDVLRATTTIAAALAAGARCAYPALEIAEARRRAPLAAYQSDHRRGALRTIPGDVRQSWQSPAGEDG